jgi:hypothetical protein
VIIAALTHRSEVEEVKEQEESIGIELVGVIDNIGYTNRYASSDGMYKDLEPLKPLECRKFLLQPDA